MCYGLTQRQQHEEAEEVTVTTFDPWDKQRMAALGEERVRAFCLANDLPMPFIKAHPADEWDVGACAFYRRDDIRICLPHCARSARGEHDYRNWNWPGATTDREPYGVLCHEAGHHLDFYADADRGLYWSGYGRRVREASGEKPISGYCPNDAEWFAEMARVFITNHALLMVVRPRTWEILMERWMPVSGDDWKAELGPLCPPRIVRSLENHIRRTPKRG